MEPYRLNTVQILNRQRSSLTKKPWATRVPKTTTSWRHSVNTAVDINKDSFGQTGQIIIPVNRRLFGCTHCILVPYQHSIAEPEAERTRLESSYTGSTLRALGRMVPIDCNVYESVVSDEIYLFYENILFVVSPSFNKFRSRGLQTRLGILEYYDFLGLMDGKKGRKLPKGQLKLPELSFSASFSEDTFLELQKSLNQSIKQ